MMGSALASNLQSPYNKPFHKIKAWIPNTGQWAPLSADIVNTEGRFGPEIFFGHTIADTFLEDDIRIVKYAAGGTALYDDWAPTNGPEYTAFMNSAQSALSELETAGVDYELAGMLWLQGESDASEDMGETYETNLTAFISHMRTVFNAPEMPFIMARVYHHYGGTTGQAKVVRDAQVKVAESTNNVEWFDTDDCERLNPDHYDAAGLITIGKRFAEKFKKMTSEPEFRGERGLVQQSVTLQNGRPRA